MKDSKTEAFILKAKLVHDDKYDYSKVEYVNNKTKICIICPDHGEFWQTPKSHLRGQGCRLCYNQRTKERLHKTTEQFISESKLIHGDKYDYSKVEYKGCFEKACIICPEHGEFWQKPQHHLQGCGCTKCRYEENGLEHRSTLESFICRANEVHSFRYDYSKTEYTGTHNKVCIICPEHGEFWQTPLNHLQGHGCTKCQLSKMESEIQKYLTQESVKFDTQKRFDWLKDNRQMILDFYLPNQNIAIECQGEQHFTPNAFFGGNDSFESSLERDRLKYQQCKEHNIEIIYYFPEEFLKYNVDFYNDKLCFHSIDDIKKYLLSLNYVKNS